MTGREILVELLPQERDVILRCILTPEVREQLLLVIVGNRVIRSAGSYAGVVKLRKQLACFNAQDIGQLGYGYF